MAIPDPTLTAQWCNKTVLAGRLRQTSGACTYFHKPAVFQLRLAAAYGDGRVVSGPRRLLPIVESAALGFEAVGHKAARGNDTGSTCRPVSSFFCPGI